VRQKVSLTSPSRVLVISPESCSETIAMTHPSVISHPFILCTFLYIAAVLYLVLLHFVLCHLILDFWSSDLVRRVYFSASKFTAAKTTWPISGCASRQMCSGGCRRGGWPGR
jgi:hypothetical protein